MPFVLRMPTSLLWFAAEVTSNSASSRIPTCRARGRESAYRVTGIGHSGNSTAVDLLSDFAATAAAAAGAHIADELRTRRDSQQHGAPLRAQNQELRMQCAMCTCNTLQATDAVTGSAAGTTSVTTSAERTNCGSDYCSRFRSKYSRV